MNQLTNSEHLQRITLLSQICPTLVALLRDIVSSTSLIFLALGLISFTHWQILTSAVLIASLIGLISFLAQRSVKPFLTNWLKQENKYLGELVLAVLGKDQLKFPPYQRYIHRRIANALQTVQNTKKSRLVLPTHFLNLTPTNQATRTNCFDISGCFLSAWKPNKSLVNSF
ncbi:hypothetical protein [Mycoplasma sp. ATU-Cv-508]|uniref:hypothetical protein n=1 Tax=Mycoplasma sp. ATU-Cv-508 TaxID=2048001 RepID=UPI000FDDA089